MLAQPMLRLPRALPARARRNRRPFQPGTLATTYRLPHEVRDRLVAALEPYRNRESAFRLAVFIARYWSVPGRVERSFFIAREILGGSASRKRPNHPELGLSEAQVRGATRTLEAVGFFERELPMRRSGRRASPFKCPTLDASGDLAVRRKPIRFVFGADYRPAFVAANRRAAAARGRQEGARRTQTPDSARGPSLSPTEAATKSPVKQSAAMERTVLNRRDNEPPPRPSDSDLGLPPDASEAERRAALADWAVKRMRGQA